MDKLERRYIPAEIEIRSDDGGGSKMIGYAAVFNSYSEKLGGFFREIIRPGAFAQAIESDDVRALWNHDSNYVLGRNKSGTLQLVEDERGLRVEITPPDTQWARDLSESMRRGDVDQMSFGFQVVDDRWYTENGEEFRELLKVRLFDVSPVTYPAYPATTIAMRSYRDIYETKPTEPEPGGEDEPAGLSASDQAIIERLKLENMR